MPRSIWNGAIAFGAVTVPIKVFGAIEDQAIHFHEVHLKDGGGIEHRLVNPKSGREVKRDEIVSGKDLDVSKPRKKPAPREVTMAGKLVDGLATDFDPKRHKDTYRKRVLDLIRQKAEGKEIEFTEPEPREAPDDLLAALQA